MRAVVCHVCLIWGCQGVVREARLFETKGTLCAYVPLLSNKGARECTNASAVRVQPNEWRAVQYIRVRVFGF